MVVAFTPFIITELWCSQQPDSQTVRQPAHKLDVEAAQLYIVVVKAVSPPEFDSRTQHAPATRQITWQAKLPFFYGWFVVAASFFSLGVSYTAWQSFSVFFVALIQEFGWSRASAAGVFSLFVIVSGLAGAGAGALSDRYGPGRIASAGGVVLAVGLVACSQISELWQFYLLFGVVAAVGSTSAGWVPCVTMLSRWFSARLGFALGVASAGIGVAILVMVPFTQWVITNFGWRVAYQVTAGTVLLLVVPVAFFVLRGRPEDFGLKKDGGAPAGTTGSGVPVERFRVVDREWVNRRWTVALALRTRRYWALLVMTVFTHIAIQTVLVHQVAYMVDGGYDSMLAASIVGLIGLVSIGAKIGSGWISDRLGREKSWTIALSCIAASIPPLLASRLPGMSMLIFLYAVVFAIGYGMVTPLTPAVTSDMFAGERLGSIYGVVTIASGLGNATGAWMGGYIFDSTGSYFLALVMAAMAGIISMAGVWVTAPGKIRGVTGALRG